MGDLFNSRLNNYFTAVALQSRHSAYSSHSVCCYVYITLPLGNVVISFFFFFFWTVFHTCISKLWLAQLFCFVWGFIYIIIYIYSTLARFTKAAVSRHATLNCRHKASSDFTKKSVLQVVLLDLFLRPLPFLCFKGLCVWQRKCGTTRLRKRSTNKPHVVTHILTSHVPGVSDIRFLVSWMTWSVDADCCMITNYSKGTIT